MDARYHLKLVLNETTGYQRTSRDLVLMDQASHLYEQVLHAIHQVISDGDYSAYLKSIEDYDRFVWEHSHQGDKSNMFAYKKIKVSPSWTEQFWAPVFERVRQRIAPQWQTQLAERGAELVLLQNTQTVTSITAAGNIENKDVDVGVGIRVWSDFVGAKITLPVIVAESKTGHFCKTACTGVDGIARRVLTFNPRVLAFTVTDNQISVGRDVEVSHAYGSGGILIMHRGQGIKSREDYPKLHAHKFEMVENGCYKYLATLQANDFIDRVTITQTNGVKLMDELSKGGYYVPSTLMNYFT